MDSLKLETVSGKFFMDKNFRGKCSKAGNIHRENPKNWQDPIKFSNNWSSKNLHGYKLF